MYRPQEPHRRLLHAIESVREGRHPRAKFDIKGVLGRFPQPSAEMLYRIQRCATWPESEEYTRLSEAVGTIIDAYASARDESFRRLTLALREQPDLTAEFIASVDGPVRLAGLERSLAGLCEPRIGQILGPHLGDPWLRKFEQLDTVRVLGAIPGVDDPQMALGRALVSAQTLAECLDEARATATHTRTLTLATWHPSRVIELLWHIRGPIALEEVKAFLAADRNGQVVQVVTALARDSSRPLP